MIKRILFVTALAAAPRLFAQQADLIVTNARIYTADAAHPRAQAVAVRGDKIIFVGSDAEAATFKGATTRVIDAHGKTVLPGLIDAHGHLIGLGSALRN